LYGTTLSRSTFNALFARDFRGMSATRASKKKMAQIVYDKYMHDRVFPNAVAHVNALKEEDYKIVLVTGSLDFMIEPLARVLRRVLSHTGSHTTPSPW
jgi:phosphoserine phosphatase